MTQSTGLLIAQRLVSALFGFALPIYLANAVPSSVLGSYFLFVSSQSVLQLVATLGVGAALIKFLSGRDNPGRYLGSGIVVVTAMTVAVIVAVVVFREQINSYIGADVWVILVGGLCLGVAANLFSTVLIGEDRIPTNALTSIAGQLVSVPTQILVVGYGLIPLVAAYNIRFLVVLVLVIVFANTRPRMPDTETIREMTSYGARASISNIEKQALRWTDLFVIGMFLGQSEAGIYGAIWVISKVAFIPTQALGTTIFPEISTMEGEDRTGELADLASLSLFVSLAVVLPILGGSILVGEQLLAAVYTDEYATAWLVLVIALMGRLFHTVHRIGRNVLLALNKPSITFRVGIISVIANVVLNLVLVSQFGLIGAAAATTLSVLVGAVPFFYYVDQTTVGSIVPTRDLVDSLLATIVMMAVVFGITTTGITTEVGLAVGVFHNAVAVAVAVGAGGVIYGLMMLAINDRTSESARRALARARVH